MSISDYYLNFENEADAKLVEPYLREFAFVNPVFKTSYFIQSKLTKLKIYKIINDLIPESKFTLIKTKYFKTHEEARDDTGTA